MNENEFAYVVLFFVCLFVYLFEAIPIRSKLHCFQQEN